MRKKVTSYLWCWKITVCNRCDVCEIGGGGVTTIGGDTNDIMPGESITFGSDTGLGAMMDVGLL
eukprot:10255724-Ditylum_brightwellii.AAC.1